MALPTAKGGSKVIEEIVLTFALPNISKVQSPLEQQTYSETPSYSQPMASVSEISESEFPVAGARIDGINQPESSNPMTKELVSSEPGFIPQKGNEVSQAPQITVIKMEELDLDAPADYDQIKMNLVDVPQTQVIIMGDEPKTDKSGENVVEEDGKAQTQGQPEGQIPIQIPPGVKHIYTIDPNVIKRLQWRIARMEDFENSVGSSVAEIKEAIAKTETTRLELEEMRKGYATVEKTMHELAALYDLISASVNPFIDSDQEQRTISTKIMKRSFGMDTNSSSTGTTSSSPILPLPSFGGDQPLKRKDEKSAEDYNVDTWTVKWAEFLLERIPKSKISALLDHYIEIGWLDEEIKARVEETIKGINEINLGIHVTDEGTESEDDRKKLEWWKLPIDDHVKALQFIEKIRGGGKGGGFTPSPDDQKKKR